MDNKNRFKLINSTNPNAAYEHVPLLIDQGGNQVAESEVLLSAAEIIDTTFGKDGFMSLEEMVNVVGELITGPSINEGLLIEDEDSGSAVKITPKKTAIKVTGQGIFEVSTGLMFDLLYQWQELMSDAKKSAT